MICVSADQFSVDQFSCPVCLDHLKQPVTTACGHNFCMVCINCFWNEEDQKGIYGCPLCKERFTPRPVLRRNIMLAEVVEKLKKTPCYARPGDVECDSCTGRKHKAIKSCLVCLTSYCEDHLKPHYLSPAFNKHKLVEAFAELQVIICSQHGKLIEIYCHTDQSFICYLCMMEEHKSHDTVPVNAEKQYQLKQEQIKSQQRIQEKQKNMQQLKETVDLIKLHAQTAVDDTEEIYKEQISFMKKKCSVVTELIRAWEEAELSQAECLLKHLEQDIADVKRRVTELEQLSHTPAHVLQSFPSLCVSPGREDSPSFTVNQQLSFDGVRNFLSNLNKQVEELYEEEFKKIVPQVAAIQIILLPEPKSREEFMQYFWYLTLDPNTVNPHLILSEENRVVTYSETEQQYTEHPERFDCWEQVLCKESVCGRCYWEVEWSGIVDISVSYKDIRRKGNGVECLFGLNSQSWSLWCSFSYATFCHNNIKTALRSPVSSRIGVYVDHSAGTLSFYSVSDSRKLLHRVQNTFTQPLYAGLLIDSDSSVRLCDMA